MLFSITAFHSLPLNEKWEVWQWCLIRTWQSSATKRCHGDNFMEKLQQVETRCQNIKNIQTKIKGHQMDDYLPWLKISAVYTICTSFFFLIWVNVIKNSQNIASFFFSLDLFLRTFGHYQLVMLIFHILPLGDHKVSKEWTRIFILIS